MGSVVISMDGRLEHWERSFNMKVTTQQRQEEMFESYKSAARRKGLNIPLIADGVWVAAHHNMHVLNTADERTIHIINGTNSSAQKCQFDQSSVEVYTIVGIKTY